MKPVSMSKYGHNQGDCLTACIASILECEIDDVPNFSGFDKEWHRKTSHILSQRGYETIFVPALVVPSLIVGDCLCIAIFQTVPGPELHAKLGRWHSTWEDDGKTWSYSVDEVFDPNKRGGFECGPLQSIFLVFPRPK